jgi:hypothetical protein
VRSTLPLAVSLIVTLAACAGGATPGSGPGTQRTTTRVETADGAEEVETFRDRRAVVTLINAPLDSAWIALPAAYQAIGIADAGVLNASQRMFGRPNLRIVRRLGSQPLSKVIDCGASYAGDADSYDVTLSVVTQLEPAGNGTRVRTWVDASGRQMASSSTRVTCGTQGFVEREIVRTLNARFDRS